MKGFSYVIQNKEGLHARPAGAIIQKASGFGSTIELSCKGKKVSLKGGIFALMGMGLRHGDAIEVSIDGPDEDAALEALKQEIESLL